MGFQIAIDGPSGSGKSTIAKMIARELAFIYIDTGAMYRTVGLYVLQNNIEPTEEEVSKHLDKINLKLAFVDDKQNIYLNEINVTDLIRTQKAADYASKMGALPSVRKKLVLFQKELAKDINVIMDGRDIGTNVLKNAQLKIYLDASVDARVKRRIKELTELGEDINFDLIKKEIEERDFRDKNRKVNPLLLAEDAIYIDSSNFKECEIINIILQAYKNKI